MQKKHKTVKSQKEKKCENSNKKKTGINQQVFFGEMNNNKNENAKKTQIKKNDMTYRLCCSFRIM